jgi:hypothetical protein
MGFFPWALDAVGTYQPPPKVARRESEAVLVAIFEIKIRGGDRVQWLWAQKKKQKKTERTFRTDSESSGRCKGGESVFGE